MMRERNHERGATMIEMAILTAATWFILTAVFDFSRYLVSLTLLTYGAQEALSAARSSPDLDKCSYNSNDSTVVCDASVETVRATIIQLAKTLPLSSIVREAEGSPQRLEAVSLHVPGIAGSTHPDPGCGPLSSAAFSIGNVFNSCPIIVQMDASIQFMTPGLGRRNFRVEASGYREKALNELSAFPEAEFFPL